MTHTKLSQEERERAWELVLYELRMLRAASKMYLNKRRPKGYARLGSMLLDSALLHARSLFEFLTHNPSNKLVVALDFLNPDSVWRPSGLDFVKHCNVKINIFRSHISKERVNMEWTWKDKLPRIVKDIEAAMKDFVSALPEEERFKWQI